MKPVSTITDKLYEKSDNQLKREIEAAIAGVVSLFCYSSTPLFELKFRSMSSEEQVNGYGVLERIKQIAFDAERDRRRQKAVDLFMRDFESFAKEISELQDNQ